MSSKDKSSAYYPGIDGIRAIAILSVFLYHLNPAWLPGGFTGVDIFFVISGFVVSYSLWRDSDGSVMSFLSRFYYRRIVRIYPALLVCLVASVVALVLFIPDSWLGRANKITAIGAFFGLSNFALYRSSDGYFSEGADYNPFLHTWSLAVEEQFYFLFPLLFLGWLRWSKRGPRASIWANILLPTLIVISMITAIVLTSRNQPGAFFLLPSRFWELGVGFLIFQIHSSGVRSSTSWRLLLQILGVGFCISGFLLSDNLGFPWPGALLPVLGSAGLIFASASSCGTRTWFDRLIEHPIPVLIGKMSYSLYLWHWPIFVVARWTTGLETVVEMVSASLLTVICGWISWRYIETTFLRANWIRSVPKTKLFLCSLALVMVIAGICGLVLKNHSRFTLSVTGDRAAWYADFRPSMPMEIEEISTEFNDILAKRILPREAPSSSSPRLYLVGDSHASAYWPVFAKFAEERNLEATVLAKGGCSLAGFRIPRSSFKPDCVDFAEWIEGYLVDRIRPGDIVLIGSIKSARFQRATGMQDFSRPDLSSMTDSAIRMRDAAVVDLAHFVEILEKAGARVVIDGLKPNFPSNAYRCSDWFNRANPACLQGLSVPRKFLLNRARPQLEALFEFTARHPSVSVWNIFEELCSGQTCQAVADSAPLFFDGDHLSGHGNAVLFPSLSRHLDSLLHAEK